jgi:hypothetical protein
MPMGRKAAGETDLRRFGCPDEVWVGSCVSEVIAAFWASLATMWSNRDDRALRLNRLIG